MVHDAELVLLAGGILAVAVAASALAARVRLPALVLFAGLGMLVGSDGFGWIAFDDYELARLLGTVALLLILFEGGLVTGWGQIRPVLRPALRLALVGTVATAAIAGLAATWLFGLSLLEGLLLGGDPVGHRRGGNLRAAARNEPPAAASANARGRGRLQ